MSQTTSRVSRIVSVDLKFCKFSRVHPVSFTALFIININFAKETPACMIGLLNNGCVAIVFDQITLSFNEKKQCESN